MDQFELPNVSGEIWEFTYKSHGELYIERSEYCGIEVKDGLNFYKFMPLEDSRSTILHSEGWLHSFGKKILTPSVTHHKSYYCPDSK